MGGAGGPADSAAGMASNRSNWDERVPTHVASGFYDVAGFVAGADPLRDFEVAELGDVTGLRLLHLQCHIGLDTLAWARRGARVTGLDFSGEAVEAARTIAARAGIRDARFVDANVYDAVTATGADDPARRFDVVYTGCGALGWLPDIDAWAATVAALLAPGGVFYLAEFHPFTDVLDEDSGLTVAGDYFRTAPHVVEAPGTYTDGPGPTVHTRTVEWQHPLGAVVSALAGAGLRIEFLHEHPVTLFSRFGTLRPDADGYHRMPDGGLRLPLMYSVRARRDTPGALPSRR